MGSIRPVKPVKYFCGIIGKNIEIINLSKEKLIGLMGKIDQESELIPFDFTDYYTEEMGSGLIRQFVSFHELMSPAKLAKTSLSLKLIPK